MKTVSSPQAGAQMSNAAKAASREFMQGL